MDIYKNPFKNKKDRRIDGYMKQTSNRRKPEKTIMLLLAVMAIGMFALPSTLAMYSGQHEFVNADSVDCNKCHSTSDAIYGELQAGNAHTAFTCKDCHGFSNSTITTPNTDDGTQGHAATVAISCIDCHAENATLGTAILDPDGITVVNEISQGTAAHKNMYSYYDVTVGDLDDACIACHTTAAMSGNITYAPTETMPDMSTWTYGNGVV